MRRHMRSPARSGFTLVELLVAAALCVLIMYVLASAFAAGTGSLSQLRSLAALSDQLRGVEGILVHDLNAYHLEDGNGKAVRVSALGVTGSQYPATWNTTTHPGAKGFFKIFAPAPAPGGANDEGDDGDTIVSERATDHWLQFTAKLPGKSPKDVFAATAPTTGANNLRSTAVNMVDLDITPTQNQFVSQWGEITYFLNATTATTTPDPASGLTPLTLFTLCRRARVVSPTDPGTAVPTTGFPDISANGGVVNTPELLTIPGNRHGGLTPTAALLTYGAGPDFGNDILLTNVVSFQVRVIQGDNVGQGFSSSLSPAGATSFDTNGSGMAPLRAIQIKIRVYDTKNQVTRQVTISQAL